MLFPRAPARGTTERRTKGEAMRGRVLNFDFRRGEGLISGEDGQRYRFSAGEWQPQVQPRAGQSVDFDCDGGHAVAIYTIAAPSPLAGEKNKIVAALLAFFLGGIGIHKFYLGKTGAGVIMLLCGLLGWVLLFIPTLIVCVIAFIEFIIYLVISEEDFERRYVHGDQSWF
jgi:TM2 domain-containing membrane protein YozV